MFCEALFLKSMMTLRYNISKPVNVIYDELSNIDYFVRFHPVVYKADCIGENEYVFYEKINFLFFPMKFNYKVNVCADNENKNIKMSSVVRKGVLLHLEFMLVPHKNYRKCIHSIKCVCSPYF